MGDRSKMLSKEFNHEGYELLNNSTHNNMKSVSIALRIDKQIKIMDGKDNSPETYG